MTGKTIGAWTVLRQNGNTKRGGALWCCLCDCGTKKLVTGGDLRSGKTQSCGCNSRNRIGDLSRTHGKAGSRIYSTWKSMRTRCNNQNTEAYKNYGGRGISICPEWDDFQVFYSWAIKHGYSDILTIERVDVNGNYCPENCTFADAQRQSENRRFVALAPDGMLWWHKAKQNGITKAAYRTRLFDGWSYEEASSSPMNFRRVPRKRDKQGRFI